MVAAPPSDTAPAGVDPVVVLGPEGASVEPGQEVTLTASVANPGGLVEEYLLEVLGVAAPWTVLETPTLSVMPGQQAEVRLVVRPPHDPTTPAGAQSIGLRVSSQENPDTVGIGETQLRVGGIYDLAGELKPVRDRARWSGRYTLTLVNHGSEAAHLALTAEDSRQDLGFALAPATIRVEPGTEQTAYLRVRARHPKLLGRPERRTFTLRRRPTGSGVGAARESLAAAYEGSFEQLPVLPKAALAALALLVAGLVLLVTLVLEPNEAARADGTLPPPVTSLSAPTVVGPDAVRLSWRTNPYAKGYVVQQVRAEDVSGRVDPEDVQVLERQDVEEDRNSVQVGSLAPDTEHCFRLVTTNDVGTSLPSAARCARTGKPPASPSPSPSPSSGNNGSSGSPTPTGSASQSPTTTATSATPPVGPGPTSTLPTGGLLILAQWFTNDVTLGDQITQTIAEAQSAGLTNLVSVDGSNPPAGASLPLNTPGVRFLVAAGFPDRAAADAKCTELKAAGRFPACQAVPTAL